MLPFLQGNVFRVYATFLRIIGTSIIFGLQKVKKLDKQLRTASEMVQNQE